MKELIIYPQVYDDLKAIKEYIAQDNLEQAVKVIDKILADIENLKSMPSKGLNLQNKVKQKTIYKYILTYRYATLYYTTKDCIYVVLVMHTAKDLSILKLLEPEN